MLYGGVFAVTRVEQRAIEAANVSLLALYKEGQSDPDPPSVDPDYSPPELRHEPRVPHVRRDRTNGLCQVPHRGAHPPSDGQVHPARLTHLLEGRIKNLRFFFSFVCVCLSVLGPSCK